jgi:hypothetical protein
MSLLGPFQPRRLFAFVSAIGGLAAAPAVLSARQLMTQLPQENDRQRRGRCFCHFRRIDAGSNDRRNLSLDYFVLLD